MRAKNEFKFLSEAYNTKLILERVKDGTLMCPEACCGAPVMECKCGPDCEHCNCHEIQKLAKEEDNEVHLQGTGWAGKPPPVDEEDKPKRGISGYEHKPDALVSAQKAGAIHKPYVSSFVSDGKKIFGVMGSDGKIVHKTRDKQKAYKWFRDNYENI